MAISTIPSAAIATDTIVATDIADDAIGTAELANDVVISTSGNITTTGKLSTPSMVQTDAQNLSGTYSTHEIIMGKTFTATGDLTVNANLVLVNMSGTGDDVTIQDDGTATTITGTGTLEGGEMLSNTPQRTDLTGMTGVLGSVVTGSPALNLGSFTGVLPVGVTGGSGLTAVNGVTTDVDVWRVHSITGAINGAEAPGANPIVNWERTLGGSATDYNDVGAVGSAMSYGGDSGGGAGIFTFPSTGMWKIFFQLQFASTSDIRYVMAEIITTIDDGTTYVIGSQGTDSVNRFTDYGQHEQTSCRYYFDVKNTSTHKVYFKVYTRHATNGSPNPDISIYGNADTNFTMAAFERYGVT